MDTNQSFSQFLIQKTTRTTKKDFIDLLESEGRYYLPAKRNIGADFLSKFLVGHKKLLKVSEVRFVTRVWKFKSCTSVRVWQLFDDKQLASDYLPDNVSIERMDKTYLLNVH